MNTLCTRIIVGVAAIGLAVGELFTGAGSAHADDTTYLNDLRANGVFVHKDAEPYMVSEAHHMCRDLHAGVPPDDVAAELPPVTSGVVVTIDPTELLSILQDNLCPHALG